jgi:glycine/D-amino acid oxidase-like deaminating enzyme
MARIIVLGGGIVGLSMGMMLRHDGHHVTVLERDRETPPTSVEDAWASWDRRGVGQLRQPHYVLPGGRRARARSAGGGDDAVWRGWDAI